MNRARKLNHTVVHVGRFGEHGNTGLAAMILEGPAPCLRLFQLGTMSNLKFKLSDSLQAKVNRMYRKVRTLHLLVMEKEPSRAYS